MQQWNANNGGKMTEDLDERLVAYYGPPLREQPLSQASWQSLHHRLNLRGRLRPQTIQRLRPRFGRRRVRPTLPLSVLEAYTRIVYDSRFTIPSTEPRSLLGCTFASARRDPAVRVSFLGHPAIQLVLPQDRQSALGNDALDVLVATGLARYRFVSAAPYQLIRVLLFLIALAGCAAALLSGLYRLLLPAIPAGILAALLLCACSIVFLGWRRRKIALAADEFVVQLLGRERTCRGLHALVDLSRAPSRRTWGEPSLAERIERVCGSHIQAHDEHLTLVR